MLKLWPSSTTTTVNENLLVQNPHSALTVTDLVRVVWDIITGMTKRNDVHMEQVHIHDQIWSMRRMRNLIGQVEAELKCRSCFAEVNMFLRSKRLNRVGE
jgi:hypothetical protein